MPIMPTRRGLSDAALPYRGGWWSWFASAGNTVMKALARLGVAASSEFLGLDDGWPVLRDALAERGVDAAVVVWDQQEIGAAELDVVLVNYCWGYVTHRAAFLDWAARVSARTRLVNPLTALGWNSDKRYLADLAADGVLTVPTTFVAPGAGWSAPAADFVIKPSVGSGGWWAARYSPGAADRAARHVETLHQMGQTVLVQPYQRAVDRSGETALVFFAGQYSHAVHKSALLERDAGVTDALWRRETISLTRPPAAHLDLARLAMAALARRVGEPVYARVDVVEGDDGTPVVLEVELVEPSLFLHLAEGAGTRFAEALISSLG